MNTSGLCLKLSTLICLFGYFAAEVWAQNYPVKVVRYIVPMSAGSGSDTIGRIVAGGLARAFGQQVIVDNRAGAAGNIGADVAAIAPADGYTLIQTSSTHAANVSLYRNLSYNLARDFAPVTQIAISPLVVVVHLSLPVKSISDFVKLAKARPGAINYASAGIGTPTWLASELFKNVASVDLVHVPYRGGAESLTAVISGEVSVWFAPLSLALPQIRQGRFRPLAVTSAKRLSLLPDYPTVAETGYPGFQAGNWYGVEAPAKTPKETIATIHRAALVALKDPDVSSRLSDLGYISVGDQPEEFGAFIKSEIATLAKIIRQTGATAE